MIPFYVYYSMFGFQRVGDLAWAAGDMQARGFLLGGTSGRTTLNGEGLQHEDGHSHILAGTIPNCVSYDPTFAHEVGVIMHHGLKRMVEKQENVFYYLTLLNENYPMPGLQARHRGADHQGHVPAAGRREGKTPRVQLLGSRHDPAREHRGAGTAGEGLGRRRQRLELPELQRAGARRPGRRALEPAAPDRDAARAVRRRSSSSTHAGPVVASTDYMKTYAEQIRAFIPKGRTYKVLGTDGFGRSDFRTKLREHFEVNRHYIVVAALKALADEGTRAGGQGGRGDHEVRHQRRQDQSAVRLTAARNDSTTENKNMALVEVKVPDIGDFKDVEVIELLVKPGDTVKAEQSLITVESDKASMEIPSSAAGVVKELKVKLGDKVKRRIGAAGARRRGRRLRRRSRRPPPAAPQPAPRCGRGRCGAPARRARGAAAGGSGGAGRGHRARHRRLQGGRRDRGAGQAGRHDQGRAER